MAIYNQPERAPRATSPACEVCGQSAPGYTHRLVSSGRTVAWREHAQNRRRVDPYYAQRAGRPEVAGQRACPACYSEVLRTVNASYGGGQS